MTAQAWLIYCFRKMNRNYVSKMGVAPFFPFSPSKQWHQNDTVGLKKNTKNDIIHILNKYQHISQWFEQGQCHPMDNIESNQKTNRPKRKSTKMSIAVIRSRDCSMSLVVLTRYRRCYCHYYQNDTSSITHSTAHNKSGRLTKFKHPERRNGWSWQDKPHH